jgi:hypothetical protein
MDTLKIAALSADDEPRWLREAFALPFVQRLRAYFAALGFFLGSPYHFGRAWVAGDRAIPNPLVAMAAVGSVTTLFRLEAQRLIKVETMTGLLGSAADTLGPYLLYAVMGAVAHVVLRIVGGTRRFGTSMGIAILAGALPGMVLALALMLPLFVAAAIYGDVLHANDLMPLWGRGVIAVVVMGSFLYFVVAFALALAGAHGLARWKGILAGIVAILVTAVLMGAVENRSQLAPLKRLSDKAGPHMTIWPGPGVNFRI